MFQHGFEKYGIIHRRIRQTKLLGRALGRAQSFTRCQARCGQQTRQQFPRPTALKVLDDIRLNAALADNFKHVARRAAVCIVIDRNAHDELAIRAVGRCFFRLC